MTDDAVFLQVRHPFLLAGHRRRDAVAGGACSGEFVDSRRVKQGIPIVRRINRRRGRWARSNRGCEGHVLTGLSVHGLRVRKTVPAHPDLVFCLRQIGDEKAPLVIRHDNARERRREIAGFRDDPHARFRAARAGDRAADLAILERQLGRSGREIAALQA